MGFIMDGLEAEAYDRTYRDSSLLRRIVGYFRPSGRLMLLVALMIALNSLADTVLPVLISRGIDVITHSTSAARSTVIWIVTAILVAGVCSWTFNFVRQRYTARAVGDVVLRLREDAFAAVMARDMSFYDE